MDGCDVLSLPVRLVDFYVCVVRKHSCIERYKIKDSETVVTSMTDQGQVAKTTIPVSDGVEQAEPIPDFPVAQYFEEHYSLEEFPYHTSKEAVDIINGIDTCDFPFTGLSEAMVASCYLNQNVKVKISLPVSMKFKKGTSTYMINFVRHFDVLHAVHIPVLKTHVSKVEICRKNYVYREDVFKEPELRHLKLEIIETRLFANEPGYLRVDLPNHLLHSACHAFWNYCIIVHVRGDVSFSEEAVVEGYILPLSHRGTLAEMSKRDVERCVSHDVEYYNIMVGGEKQKSGRCKVCKKWWTLSEPN